MRHHIVVKSMALSPFPWSPFFACIICLLTHTYLLSYTRATITPLLTQTHIWQKSSPLHSSWITWSLLLHNSTDPCTLNIPVWRRDWRPCRKSRFQKEECLFCLHPYLQNIHGTYELYNISIHILRQHLKTPTLLSFFCAWRSFLHSV